MSALTEEDEANTLTRRFRHTRIACLRRALHVALRGSVDHEVARVSESEEKTRVTAIVQKPLGGPDGGPKGNDCLVVIYTKEPTLLGRRFVLDSSPIRVGRGAENHIVLDGDSVSRRHAHFEQRTGAW